MYFQSRPRTLSSLLVATACLVSIPILLSVPSRAGDSIKWKNIGPGGGGNIWSISIKPDDPNVILMGSDVGGFYRSGDGGSTWSLVNSPTKIDPTRYGDYTTLGAFGWDPTTGNTNIVYKGVYRSTDAGQTWTASSALDSAPPNINIRYLLTGGVVDPTAHDTVYAWSYSENYVYKTTDHWTAAANASCTRLDNTACTPSGSTDVTHSVIMNPVGHTQLMACADSGIYYNQNWGSWNAVSFSGLPHAHCAQMRVNSGGVIFVVLRTYIDGTLHEGLSATSPYVDVNNWQGGLYVCQSVNWSSGTASCSPANGLDSNDLLLGKGSFEGTGDANHPAQYWKTLSGTIVQDPDFFHIGSGTHSLKFTKTTAGTGIMLDLNPPLAVSGGELMKVSLWVYADDPSGFVPLVYLHTYTDAAGTLGIIPPWQADDGLVVLNLNGGIQPGGWKKYAGWARVPDEARSIKLEVDVSGGSGTSDVWYDDVEIRINHSLPRMTGHVYSAAYNDIAIDSQNGLVMYALTRETSVTDNLAGVWKTTDGGVNWNLVTREGWHENVIDEALSVPKCGDGVCGGRWETCDTCPVDCGPHTADCCGDGHRDPDETSDTCLADVPWDADPNVTLPYHEADYFLDKQNVHGKNPMNGPPTPFGAFLSPNGDFWGTTHALAIGNGTSGHNTLFFGNRRYKTIDAGVTWTAMDGTQFQGTGVDAGSMQAHGDATDTFVSSILTLSQDQLTGCGTAGCVFYGDHDNRLMVSSNGGASFEQEGWQWFNAAYPYACPVLPGIDGAITPTSIIAGPTGSVYVAAGVGFGADSVPYHSGVVKGIGPSNPALPLSGQTDLCKGRWTWTTPGTSLPWTNGAVDLFRRDSSSLLFATVYGSGVYKFNETSQTWYTLSINDQAPTGAKVTKIAGTTGTGARTFVAAGDTSYCDPDPITQLCTVPPASETGVWESCDDGSTWHKIAGLPGTLLESEPVTSLLPVGNNTLYVSTTFLFGGATVSNSVWSTNDGGVYKATYDPNSCDGNEWSGWSRVLAQPRVAAVGVSNNSSASLYAVANQICCSNLFSGVNAGVYKSDDSGATWNLLKNDGLMNLADRNPNLAQLKMSSIDPHKLYYGTVGSGLFEGLITCGTVAEGFTDWDGDGIADCSDTMLDAVQQITPLANGFIASGGLSNLYSTSANGTYEVLTENGSPKKLAKVWQFNVVTGRSYSLNVEAYKTDSASADDFKFSYAFQSTACTSSSAGGIALVALTVIKRGSDQDTVQTASLGSAGSNSVLCIRAADSKLTNDNQADSLTIDRIYLTLNSDAIASADQSIGPGTATGTYTNTQVSDSSREQLTETQVSVPGGNTSSLVQTWRFDLVPAGSSHKLHVQGYRPNNTEGDDFQFYYSFDNVNFFPISGAIINNATETTNAYIISETQGGTWYIRVQDTNSAAAQNPVLDSVYVNFLTIEAVP